MWGIQTECPLSSSHGQQSRPEQRSHHHCPRQLTQHFLHQWSLYSDYLGTGVRDKGSTMISSSTVALWLLGTEYIAEKTCKGAQWEMSQLKPYTVKLLCIYYCDVLHTHCAGEGNYFVTAVSIPLGLSPGNPARSKVEGLTRGGQKY